MKNIIGQSLQTPPMLLSLIVGKEAAVLGDDEQIGAYRESGAEVL